MDNVWPFVIVVLPFLVLLWFRYCANKTPVLGPWLCGIGYHHPVRTVLDEESDIRHCRWCMQKHWAGYDSTGTEYYTQIQD